MKNLVVLHCQVQLLQIMEEVITHQQIQKDKQKVENVVEIVIKSMIDQVDDIS